jgi:hypothetical protein
MICPDTRLFVEQACPGGLLCQEANIESIAQLKECPPGYVCPKGTTTLERTSIKTSTDFCTIRALEAYAIC